VRLALALLAGGAVGNLVDRIRVGAVIDYLDVHIWPVFNLADLAVTAGAGLLIGSVVLGADRDVQKG
jgi:signal peptidase II